MTEKYFEAHAKVTQRAANGLTDLTQETSTWHEKLRDQLAEVQRHQRALGLDAEANAGS